MEKVNKKRVKILKKVEKNKLGPVVYWMSQDQRVFDNWALIYAKELAYKQQVPLIVVFTLYKSFSFATLRQYGFMIDGLKEVSAELFDLNIPFFLLSNDPLSDVVDFMDKYEASSLVMDFGVLRYKKELQKKVVKEVDSDIFVVDAHYLVPVLVASSKQEFSARTIRPKIQKEVPEFLTTFPVLKKEPGKIECKQLSIDWEKIKKNLKIDFSVKEVDWIKPGYKSGMKLLKNFIEHKADLYVSQKNDPNINSLSDLSPYLHFGQISAQRIAYEIKNSKIKTAAKEVFLEELIVRRELAANFCFYNEKYDSIDGFPEWSKKTLREHLGDKRDYLYNLADFEKAKTHDDLWNAAQKQLLDTGKMHGYLRMYWAKKILEWSPHPKKALEIAIYLNDKYELDGRDPNGYAGIAWSIGGLHDRPWFTRPIFGLVRYMSYSGLKKKIDIEKFISKIL